ncbi:MAG: T9SS type A sorting domain-containing protein [Ignavibacteria bacterium]|nr:T9SS type A sorting domain-containing protein [Ignavibacteria bacterium]
MKRYLFLFVFILAGYSFSQPYPLRTIQEITTTPDSLLSPGTEYSPFIGDTVRLRGLITVKPVVDPSTDRRRVIAAGGRWYAYVQDPNGLPFGGISIIQNDTTGVNQNSGFDLVDTAQVWEFTAVLSVFSGNTVQANLLVNPPTPVEFISQATKRPDPIELPMTTFMENGVLKGEGEKYEGMYVIIRNVLTSDRNNSSGVFRFNDGNGNFMEMYDQSGYFTKRAHRLTGLTDYDAPADGTFLEYIRGVVHTRATGYYIVPLYPGDIKVGATPPSISNIARNNAFVARNVPVEVSARIVDLDGRITSGKLFYRVNMGSYNELALVRGTADTNTFSATIPGVDADSAVVDYFFWAQDNENRITLNPADTTRNRWFYPVLNRPLTIQDVQYSPYGSGFSAVNNYRVTVSGVVTADTSDIPGFGSTALRVYIQNGSTPWSGIWVKGFDALNLKRGDLVTVSGKVVEDFNVTCLDSVTAIVVNSTNNPTPEPIVVTTGTIGAKAGGVVDAEKYESVLIKYTNPVITRTNADLTGNFGEMLVDDNSGGTRVELQDGNHQYHNNWEPNLSGIQVDSLARFSSLTGVLYFSFSNYKLTPRKDADFVGYTTDIKDNLTPAEFSLSQNYPNPFNPSTAIEFSLPKGENVKLEIFDVLGRSVQTIINEYKEAGNYKVYFNASALPSGMYIYRIDAGAKSSVKKMILMK